MVDFGQEESSSQETSKSFLPIQEDVLKQFLKSQRGRIGQGQESFAGLRVAPFQALQEQAFKLAPEAFFRTPEQEADIFKEGIETPALRRFREETTPLIDESFAGPGFFGSARAQERVRAGESLAANLETERSNLRRETETLNRQGIASLFGFGTAQQQQEQRLIQADIERFAEENRLTDPEDVAILTALLGLNFSTASGKTSSSGFNIGLSDKLITTPTAPTPV